MKIPRRLMISGQNWKVDTSKSSQLMLDEQKAFGMSIFNDQVLYLSTKSNKRQMEKTFLHEVLHILIHQTGLGCGVLSDGNTEEQVTQALSFGLYQVLKDNKLLRN